MSRAKKKARKAPPTQRSASKVYALSILPEALKAIKAIGDAKLRRRIGNEIEALAINPMAEGCKPIGDGLRRVRVSDWRIIYRIDDTRVVVCVLRVGKRDEVYRALEALRKVLIERAEAWTSHRLRTR